MEEEQQPSVSDILSSIRQILSDKMDEETVVTQEETTSEEMTQIDNAENVASDDVYMLTPDMIAPETQEVNTPVETIRQPVENISKYVSDQSPLNVPQSDVQQAVREWLDANLPSIVERIVTQEVQRIFNKH